MDSSSWDGRLDDSLLEVVGETSGSSSLEMEVVGDTKANADVASLPAAAPAVKVAELKQSGAKKGAKPKLMKAPKPKGNSGLFGDWRLPGVLYWVKGEFTDPTQLPGLELYEAEGSEAARARAISPD